MTSDDANNSKWVEELFAANASDWTPAAARHVAYVLYAPVSRDAKVSKRCASILSDAELERADRFVTEEGRTHFIERRAFRRYCGALAFGARCCLSQIVFKETEKGRPFLPDMPDCQFSFSSCRFGFLGAWSSTHALGIDLEDQTRNLEASELAQRFFCEAEAKAVKEVSDPARLPTFFQLWSLKEAALKSIGEGLPYGLNTFEFELAPNLRVVHAPLEHGGPERFNAHVIEEINICAALVTRSMV